jgi:hypothetical protein
MRIKFTQAARKHRIGKARVLFVIESYSPSFLEGDLDYLDRYVWIGKDDRGVELEIVALILEEYLLITHVMPTDLRKGKGK